MNVNPISSKRFLTVLSQTLISVSTHLSFIYFVVHFLFSRHIAMSFLSWRFDIFRVLPVFFSFFNHPISLIFTQLIANDESLSLNSTVECFFEWVLQAFQLFELTRLFLELCFLLVRNTQMLVNICKKCLLTVQRLAYARLLLVFALGIWILKTFNNCFLSRRIIPKCFSRHALEKIHH